MVGLDCQKCREKNNFDTLYSTTPFIDAIESSYSMAFLSSLQVVSDQFQNKSLCEPVRIKVRTRWFCMTR